MTRDNERDSGATARLQLGRYELLTEIAAGDLTTVYLARQQSQAGFSRLVALKRLKPLLARQAEYADMLADEAKLGAGLHHANLVSAIDASLEPGECYLVMEYVEGDTLAGLLHKAGNERHPRFLAPLFVDLLSGLHAAHTTLGPDGAPMSLVHQAPRAEHVLVGIDGIARLADFGQARSPVLRPSRVRTDRLRIGYMAPEQVLKPDVVDHRADLFIVGIAMWEALTGKPLFDASTEEQTFQNLLHRRILPPSEVNPEAPPCFDAVCLAALEREPAHRHASAAEMARELRDTAMNHALLATAQEVGQWVKALCGSELIARRRQAGGDTPSQQVLIDDGSGSGLFESHRASVEASAFADDDAPTSMHPSLPPSLSDAPVGEGDSSQVPIFSDEQVLRAADTAPLRSQSVAPSAFVQGAPRRPSAFDDPTLPSLYDAADADAPTRVMPSLEERERVSLAHEESLRERGLVFDDGDAPTRKVAGLSDSPDTAMNGGHHSVVEQLEMDSVDVAVAPTVSVPSLTPSREVSPTRLRRQVREENRAEPSGRRDSHPQRMAMSSGPVGDVFAPVATAPAPLPAPSMQATLPPVAKMPDSLAPPSQAYTLPPDEEFDEDVFRAPGRSRTTAWVALGVAATALLAWALLSMDRGPAAPSAASPTRVEDATGVLPAPLAAEDDEAAAEADEAAAEAAEVEVTPAPPPVEANEANEADEAETPEVQAAAPGKAARTGKAAKSRPQKKRAKTKASGVATPATRKAGQSNRRDADWRGRGAPIPDNPF